MGTVGCAAATTTETEPYGRLLSWINAAPLGKVGPVRIAPSRVGEGLGLFLTEDVGENDLLFTVPPCVFIGLDVAADDVACGAALRRLAQEAGSGGSTVALAGFLAKQWLCGPADALAPYLEALPAPGSRQSHVLLWPETRLARLEPPAFAEAMALRTELVRATRRLQQLLQPTVRAAALRRGDVGGAWAADERIAQAVRRGFVCLLSRSFSYELGEVPSAEADVEAEAGETLVPLLDMLQHGSEPSVTHWKEATHTGAQLVVVRARRDLSAGHELLNRYLDPVTPAHVWLTRYGFVPQEAEGIAPELVDELTTMPKGKGSAFG